MIDRLEKIESQIRLWGIDNLTPQGKKEWTEDIYWLIEQALYAYKYELALKKIVEIGETTFKTESEVFAERVLNSKLL